MARSNLLNAVEAAYQMSDTEEVWLAEVVDALRPHLDSGLGAFGWLYDASNFAELKFFHPTFRGVDPKIAEALLAANSHPSTTLPLVRRHYATPAGPFSHSLGKNFAAYAGWHSIMPRVGVQDLLVLNGMDPNRRGCAVLAPRKTISRMSAPRRALLARVATHLSTGLRLWRRLKATSVEQHPGPEATLDSTGKIHHAVGAAAHAEQRNALQLAVRAMDRARGRLRRADPEEALRIWRAMVNGRWTLIDRFENDGRHYIVAHVNEPSAPVVRGLSARERQIAAWSATGHSNKLIAYELGIAASSVSTHLAHAIRTLGLRGVADLARVFPDALVIQSDEADAIS
jgi:DNA-binding CsgD family transcriptional regulator